MSVNFIFLIIGLLVSSVVPPLAFMLTWPAVPRGAAIASALGGQACGPTVLNFTKWWYFALPQLPKGMACL